MSGGKSTVPRAPGGVDLGIEGLSAPVLIGQGGFGAVYRAEQTGLGRTVAVKILSAPGFDERTQERFERECVAIGALSDHPHIVTVHDSGINEWGRPFIVMDFMARGSVADRVALDGAMEWPEVVDMTIKLAGAVASAHAAGILHRDIKPQNVLISAYGEPKLGDFGISSIGSDQTSSGTVTASLEHAAPELLDGRPATVGSDVYALASTAFTMVAGEAPFERQPDEPIQSLISRIVQSPVPDLRPRGVPGTLCDVLERALAKDPAQRYPTASEFADELRRVQTEHGVAPTTIVEAVPVGGFDVLDRFTPKGGGSTAPTRTRVRTSYSPPPAPQPVVPLWKRRGVLALVSFVVLALAATATAVTVTREPDRKEEPSVAPVTEETAPVAKADTGTNERDRARSKTPTRKKQRAGSAPSFGSGSSGGASGSSFVPPSSGSSTGSGSAPSTGGGTKKDGGKAPAEEKEPPPPPDPDVVLYHAHKEGDHVVFTDKGLRTRYVGAGYEVVEVGRVYSYPEDGTRSLPLDEGTAYGFASSSGETSPQTGRTQLWRVSKGGEFFYSSNPDEVSYYTDSDWYAGAFGWVGT